jgi:hypothetical protein
MTVAYTDPERARRLHAELTVLAARLNTIYPRPVSAREPLDEQRARDRVRVIEQELRALWPESEGTMPNETAAALDALWLTQFIQRDGTIEDSE